MMNRISNNFPVQYRVEFPNGKPVPMLTQITYNGDVICSGPGGEKLMLSAYNDSRFFYAIFFSR